jgi:uncharacterized membrane protein
MRTTLQMSSHAAAKVLFMTDKANLHRLIVGRAIARWTLAVIYLVAGIFHIWKPETFLLITPDWVPFPKQVIFITGICEVVGAFALLTTRLRYAAGIAFALYAVCVYPANIKHAFYGLPLDHVQLTWWYHAPRLAFQPVLVWWALFVGEVTLWPFGRHRARFDWMESSNRKELSDSKS